VRSGEEASESFLKQTDLGEFGVLHFAAHTVVDYDHPDRSAVVLFPGSEEEDGFLQVREVVDLNLDNKVVVLSSCRSASGTVFRGDGITGLARGFFLAGARAVVGSLWPVRDDQAKSFMLEFYDRLTRGMSLSEAMAGARASRIDAGAPTSAWAGFILLGDGGHVPFPGGTGTDRRLLYFIVAGSIVLITVLTLVAARRQKA
jgi:CHAT domain-containing protein